ncbi:MAG: Holliday junction resolvase RuvX [Blastocatellales bacterium]
MRVMAVDYGSKAIGLAISDELQVTVRPLTTIRRERKKHRQVIESLCNLVDEYQVATVVVGLPLNMDGTRGEAVEKVESFISELQPRLSVPIVTIDERLTSYEADQILREMGASQKERKAKSDEYAAVLILQDYLDGQFRQKLTQPRLS